MSYKQVQSNRRDVASQICEGIDAHDYALVDSIIGEKVETVRLLLGARCLRQIGTLEYHWTPVHSIAWHGKADVLKKIFLMGGVNVNLKDEVHRTPLWYAASKGEMETVLLLLEFMARRDGQDKDGLTPLHVASREGHTEVVEVLVQQNASLTLSDINCWTACHMAVSRRQTKTVQKLLEMGSNPSAESISGLTPLHLATYLSDVSLCKLLLEFGSNVNAKTKVGVTPIYQAIMSENEEIILLFLQYGASVNEMTTNGWICLHSAVSTGNLQLLKLLEEHGANLNCVNNVGWNVLHLASYHGHHDCVKWLLEVDIFKGAEQTKHGNSYLHLAAQSGHPRTLGLLLSHIIDPNPLNKDGRTPLHLACLYGQHECVNILIKISNADMNCTEKNEWTALDIAYENQHKQVITLLERSGAPRLNGADLIYRVKRRLYDTWFSIGYVWIALTKKCYDKDEKQQN